MPSGAGKCSRIQCIVRLRQMLRRWRAKAAAAALVTGGGGSLSGRIPSDVPAGHVAVCVGINSRRFVVRATYLNHPLFRKILAEAEEEYGFSNHGPLAIPCDESIFEEIVRFLSRNESWNCNGSELKRCGSHRSRNVDCWVETHPLLHGLSEKSVW